MSLKRRLFYFVILTSIAAVGLLKFMQGCREYKSQIERGLAGKASLYRSWTKEAKQKEIISDVQPQASAHASAKNLPLNLRLLGTVFTEPALAYIEDPLSQENGPYKIGDVVRDARLVEIRSGEVVLERGGEKKTLVLAKEKAITKLSEDKMLVSRKGLMEEIAWDLDEIAHMATVSLCYDKSSKEFSGVKVDNILQNSLIKYAGFRNGDMIKAINGQRLNSPQRAIQAMRKARRLPKLDIDLLRRQEWVKLSYDIKE